MYTGVGRVTEEDGSQKDYQTQCMAVGDGTDYTEYENNPVITTELVPEGGSKITFVILRSGRMRTGCFMQWFRMLQKTETAQYFFFKSEDAFHWDFCSVIDRSDRKLGKMWECPDFFELDGKHVLVVSPMAIEP